MSVQLQRLDQAAVPEIATTLRNAGIAGAGGAGFPTHAKWEHLADVPFLMVNHQESEPMYYMDKYLGQTRSDEFARFFDVLLEDAFECIVVCAKAKDRDGWIGDLEAATDGSVYQPEDLPLDPMTESGIVFAYTEDRYEFGMESVLLRMTVDVVLQDELPMDHGWIVQNTETLYNVLQALEQGDAVTRKFVHVDGNVPEHRFLHAPIGTPAEKLLEASGRTISTLGEHEQIVDGGPGWSFEIDSDPREFGVRKRTNAILVLDEDDVEANTLGGGRVNVLNELDWTDAHETEPTPVEPDHVRIPLVTNPKFDDVVASSRPIVDEGDRVETGEMIAVPGEDGVSNAQHASIDGTVTAVTDSHVVIERGSTSSTAIESGVGDDDRLVYWTWCNECGTYVARPDPEHLGTKTQYRCPDCR